MCNAQEIGQKKSAFYDNVTLATGVPISIVAAFEDALVIISYPGTLDLFPTKTSVAYSRSL